MQANDPKPLLLTVVGLFTVGWALTAALLIWSQPLFPSILVWTAAFVCTTFFLSSLRALVAVAKLTRMRYKVERDSPRQVPMGLMQRDTYCGFCHVPGYIGYHRRIPDFDVLVRINSLGLRNDEIPAREPDEYRVLVLGDSFTAGHGVEEIDAFPSLLSRYLQGNTSHTGHIRVINAGVPGFGTIHEVGLLKKLADILHPDLVVLALFVGNDIRDNLLGLTGQVVSWDGLLRLSRASRRLIASSSRWFEPQNRNPRMSSPVDQRGRKSRASYHNLPLSLAYDFVFLLDPQPPELEVGWTRTAHHLSDLKILVEAHRAGLLLVLIPMREQVDDEQWKQIVRAFGLQDVRFDMALPQRRLQKIAHELGIETLDLLEPLRAAAHYQDVYFPNYDDGHWNSNGHLVAADVLAKFLAGRLV